MDKLIFSITTCAPIIISTGYGGSNYTGSFDYIPGSTIRGIIASKFLEMNPTLKNAETDPEFRSLFLNSEVIYKSAFLSISNTRSLPIPKNIKKQKASKEQIFDTFENAHLSAEPSAEISGYMAENEIQSVDTNINFHHARLNNRVEGKPESGGIFSYESINKNVTFECEIIADRKRLERIVDFTNSPFETTMGRSRTSQYGKVQITKMKIVNCETLKKDNTSISIHFVTPAIILNENGFPCVNISTLKNHLEKRFDFTIHSIEYDENGYQKSIIKSDTFETYNRLWGMKTCSSLAFDAGTVMKVNADFNSESILDNILKQGIGERNQEGFGEVNLFYGNQTIPTNTRSDHLQSLAKPKVLPPHVKELFEKILRKEFIEISRSSAFLETLKGKLPNSLAYRLINVISNAQSFESLSKTLQDTMIARSTNPDIKESDSLKQAGFHLNKVRFSKNNKSLWNIFSKPANIDHAWQELLDKDQVNPLLEMASELDISINFFGWEIYQTYWKTLLLKKVKVRSNGK